MHLQTMSEHPKNALRDHFGTFRAEPRTLMPECSHFRAAAKATRNEKVNTSKGVEWSEREDLNLRPLVSQTVVLRLYLVASH